MVKKRRDLKKSKKVKNTKKTSQIFKNKKSINNKSVKGIFSSILNFNKKKKIVRKAAPIKKKNKKIKLKEKITKKKGVALVLEKYIDNPIIMPNKRNLWESWQTFNPGTTILNDKIYFLYRAIGDDGISRLGYASSKDGFFIDKRLPYPAYEHKVDCHTFNIYSFASGGSLGGCEDPRLVYIEEDKKLYITYTACDGGLGVALTSISLKDFLNNNWKWSPPIIISPPGEIHKNWVIFPEKIKGKYAILHSISPKIQIEYVKDLKFSNKNFIESKYEPKNLKNRWDNWLRGAGPPPIKTKVGWLLLYHAMDRRDPGKYKVGAMILDLDNPSKILFKSKEPILEPVEDYENHGFKSGVVYASGAIVKDKMLYIYYGGADSYVCVVYANLGKFLRSMVKGSKPKVKKVMLKKK